MKETGKILIKKEPKFKVNHVAECISDYSEEGTMKCKLGERFHIIEEVDLGWALAKNMNGEIGFIPASFVAYLQPNEKNDL